MEERNMNRYDFDSDYASAGLTLNQYIARTFGWMFLGLTVTFVLAAVLALSGAVIAFFTNRNIPAEIQLGLPIGILIAEIVVVMALSLGIRKRSVGTNRVLFLVYSVLNGLVFSSILVAYEMANVIVVFGMTALFFGAFALYGRFTRADLSRLGPLLIGGVFFLLIASVLSMFFNMSQLERAVCLIGIVIFLCFTAYDVQKIKANYEYFYGDEAMLQKASIYSALELYLDFINLFIRLLSIFGRSRR